MKRIVKSYLYFIPKIFFSNLLSIVFTFFYPSNPFCDILLKLLWFFSIDISIDLLALFFTGEFSPFQRNR